MTLEELNSEFGNDWVEFVAGEGGFPKAIINAQCGGRAEVYLHGGNITAWKTPHGRERLFCSSKAQYPPGKAIRGGVPIIYPQFGPGPITTHGFARSVP